MAAANILCAAIVGYRFFGIDGMCAAAIVAWVLAAVGAFIFGWQQDTKATKILDALEMVQKSLTAGMNSIAERLPATPAFYAALLNGTDLDDYRLLEMHDPKSPQELEKAWPRVWPSLRRRLVHCHGLSSRKVDAAKECLLDTYATQNRLPQSDKELEGVIDDWRAAAQWADHARREAETSSGGDRLWNNHGPAQ